MSGDPEQLPNPSTSAKVVAGSLLGGGVFAAALVAGPFGNGEEAAATGAVLLGFAAGWALLAMLSTHRGDSSHRWAALPATLLGASGLALVCLAPSSDTLDAMGWVWPPALLGLVIWMMVQTRRQPVRSRGWWALYPVFALMVASAIGGGLETIHSHSSDGPRQIAGNRLVNVGDHRLNIHCIGSGSPTVLLEPGLGEPASAMAELIAPQVARTTRVCVYDRAGHGRSDVAPNADANHDLHMLLDRARIPGPYVLVGHSLGGPLVLGYTGRYPSEVGGMVLIDSMHPKQTHTAAAMSPVFALAPTIARTGIARLLLGSDDGEPVDQVRQFARDVKQMPAQLNQAAQFETYGDIPLAVVSAEKDTQPGWARKQSQLAALSSSSRHRTIAGSTHGSLVLDPEDAMASSREIEAIVRLVRSRL